MGVRGHFVLPVCVCASVEFHCQFQMDGPALTPQKTALDATPPACFPIGEGKEETHARKRGCMQGVN